MYRDIHKTFESFTKLLKTLQREKNLCYRRQNGGEISEGAGEGSGASIRFFGCSRMIAPGVGDQRAWAFTDAVCVRLGI